MTDTTKIIGALMLGIILGIVLVGSFNIYLDTHTHYDEEVHVHSDILVYVDDKHIEFTDDKYQSSAEQILHDSFHFHGGDGEVVHRHAADLTLAEFFESLDIILTNDCLTLDDDRKFCTNENETLQLYVNGEIVENIINYVPRDEDRILLYFGGPNNPDLSNYLNNISDRACIFSGTCPERGTPPPESCGLTCEL